MSNLIIYTIGHGRHSFKDFLSLLQKHEIRFLCDVRSVARSRWVQFNGQVLAAALDENGIGYEHMPECGGKTVVPRNDFERGILRIVELASDVRVAIMCSESQPLTTHKEPRANCHRVGSLSIPLKEHGARIIHILPNGDTLELDESKIFSIWNDKTLSV